MSPRPQFEILDKISDPGKADRANEDRFGHNGDCAFVVDGATGLGDRQYMDDYGSDAAWIADFAATRLAARMTADASAPEVIRAVITEARDSFTAAAGEQPRYAWPLCALAMVAARADGFVFSGFGDSALYLLEDGAEEARFVIPLPGAYQREQASARAHIERTGGLAAMGRVGTGNTDPETLAFLRESRARQNSDQGSVWSLGLVPEAADHLFVEPLPLSRPATAILCSDGLADLVALYNAYDARSLVTAAREKGLAALVTELRHFEREVDPDGLRFPRYKQSDDTTALLLRLNP